MTQWIESAGGPLIALPVAHAADWRGVSPRSDGSSDYDRACAINEYLGLLSCNGNDVLVLGDEPHRTCWIPQGNGGLLVRWVYAESEGKALAAVRNLSAEEMRDDGVRFTANGTYRLMDAADSGDEESQNFVELDLLPGRYRVLETFVDPDESTRVLVHALVLE